MIQSHPQVVRVEKSMALNVLKLGMSSSDIALIHGAELVAGVVRGGPLRSMPFSRQTSIKKSG